MIFEKAVIIANQPVLSTCEILPQLKNILVKFFLGFQYKFGKDDSLLSMTCNKTTGLIDFSNFHSSVFLSMLLGIVIWSFAITYIRNFNNSLYHHWFLCPFSDFHSLTLSALLTILLVFHITSLGSHLTRKSKTPNQQSHIMVEPLSSFKKLFTIFRFNLRISFVVIGKWHLVICNHRHQKY